PMTSSDSLTGPREVAPAFAPGTTPVRKRRWVRRLFAALILLGALGFICRGPFLRGIASFLVADDPLEHADFALLDSGDGALGEAVRLYKEGWTSNILLQEHRLRRLETLKILPTSA